MIITLLNLVDPSAFKHFDMVVINAAVNAIRQLKVDDRFDLSFVTITRVPDDLDIATFIAHIYEVSDTGGAYIGDVRFSTDERRAVFETKAGGLIERRNAIRMVKRQ